MGQPSMEGVCICIPTRNRAEMVKEVLEYTRPYYADYRFKILYFDSSDNDETRKVIEAHKEAGYCNLMWKSMDTALCLDRKMFEIFKEDEEVHLADYIWLINDSIAITKDALETIAEIVEEDYDLIRLPASGEGKKEDYICTDINDWFHQCSKGMAHMASTIMSSTLFGAVSDWRTMYEKYVVTDRIGDGQHEYFFTLGFYLEQIAKLEHFKGIMLGKHRQWRRDSPCKKGNSYWNDLVFEVWVRSYCDTILKLPDCYTDKPDVIRCSDNIVYGRFERQSMVEYRRSGLLTKEIVLNYRKYWEMVSTLSFDELIEIASTPTEKLSERFGNRLFDSTSWEKNIERLESRLNGKKVIIYGAGIYGSYALKKLLDDGYANEIAGVAVSDTSQNLDDLEGYPVQNIHEFMSQKKEAEVMIATLPDTALEIEKILSRMGFKNLHLICESFCSCEGGFPASQTD